VAQGTERKHLRQYLKREMPQSRSYSAAVVNARRPDDLAGGGGRA
jgi:hypothetical protein